jgi:hypothetical protein
MGIELVLNDLSFEPLASDKMSAQQRVLGFQRTASAAIKMRANRLVRCPENIQRKFLAAGYSMGDWLNDPTVDIDLRRVVLSWLTKSPYWQDDHDLEQKVHSRIFYYAGIEGAIGLGVASLLNGLSVSLLSHGTWDQTSIEIRALTEFLDDDGEASTQDEVIAVRHIGHPNHLEAHKQWIDACLAINPSDGQELWDKRKEWFPNLDFCNDTKAQLYGLPRQMLSSVSEHLSSLQRYSETWSSGNFDSAEFPPRRIVTETKITLQQYGAMRTFMCPDGITRTFSWHLRLTPQEWRIHFDPIPQTRQIVIGYIGQHLPTAKFNN